MNPRTRRIRKHRRRARKAAEIMRALLKQGFPRLKIASEMASRFPSYAFHVRATFDAGETK